MYVCLFLLKKFKEDVLLTTIYASTMDPQLHQQFVIEIYNEGITRGASGSSMTATNAGTSTGASTNQADFDDIYE
ncbi:hypothetical protein V8B97DRAFT_1878584 [Scleroderma yunnanense]